MFLGHIFRKNNVRESEIQQNSVASTSENENHTDLVAYMTTISDDGAQNDGDTNTDGDREDAYQYIPDESEEYSYAYTDVKGQKNTNLASATKQSEQPRDHNTECGNQASGKNNKPAEKKSDDGQQAYAALILEEVDKGNQEKIPQIYTQLKPLSGEQEQGDESVETNLDANQFYVNSNVVKKKF